MKKQILFLIMLFGQLYKFMVQVVTAIMNPETYKPVMHMIDEIVAQVVGIKYTFDKKPCSALGGVA